jgi:hypothetical protein
MGKILPRSVTGNYDIFGLKIIIFDLFLEIIIFDLFLEIIIFDLS